MNFYNHDNKSIFKSALNTGPFESVSIMCGARHVLGNQGILAMEFKQAQGKEHSAK